MRRYKRKGLRNLCDSRSSRTHRSICPLPPHRRLHYLTPNYFSVLVKLWRKMEKGLVFLYRIGYHMYYSIISQYFKVLFIPPGVPG